MKDKNLTPEGPESTQSQDGKWIKGVDPFDFARVTKEDVGATVMRYDKNGKLVGSSMLASVEEHQISAEQTRQLLDQIEHAKREK